jgi:hypothetical protein
MLFILTLICPSAPPPLSAACCPQTAEHCRRLACADSIRARFIARWCDRQSSDSLRAAFAGWFQYARKMRDAQKAVAALRHANQQRWVARVFRWWHACVTAPHGPVSAQYRLVAFASQKMARGLAAGVFRAWQQVCLCLSFPFLSTPSSRSIHPSIYQSINQFIHLSIDARSIHQYCIYLCLPLSLSST